MKLITFLWEATKRGVWWVFFAVGAAASLIAVLSSLEDAPVWARIVAVIVAVVAFLYGAYQKQRGGPDAPPSPPDTASPATPPPPSPWIGGSGNKGVTVEENVFGAERPWVGMDNSQDIDIRRNRPAGPPT